MRTLVAMRRLKWAFLAHILVTTANANELTLTGSFTQGGLVIGQADKLQSVAFEGQKVSVSPDGHFVLGFNRDEVGPLSLHITYQDQSTDDRLLEIIPRQYNIQHIEGLPPKLVTPDENSLARRRLETQLVKRTRLRDDARTNFLETFVWPAQGRVSGVYGSQRILNGQPRRPHFGLDIAAPVGTPVIAPVGGVVTLVHPDMYFSGGTLIVDHGHGVSSTFIHLSKIDVSEGDIVKQGRKIAEIGQTGRATGPHLDWRINWFERRLDPQLLVEQR